MTETPTRFGLMRHTVTVWNVQRKIQGREDSPVTPEGEILARSWGPLLEPFHWDRILASDAKRAVRTAGLVNETLGLPLSVDERLTEIDWGEWTGKTIPWLDKAAAPYFADPAYDGWDFAPPGGESRLAVNERGKAALEDAAQKWPGENILVVAHEGVIKCVAYRLAGRPFRPGEPELLKKRHLHILRWDGGRLAIERLNALDLNVAGEPL